MIYFIYQTQGNLVRIIDSASNKEAVEESARKHNPFPQQIKVIAEIPDGNFLLSELKERFSEESCQNDWYRLSGKMRAFITKSPYIRNYGMPPNNKVKDNIREERVIILESGRTEDILKQLVHLINRPNTDCYVTTQSTFFNSCLDDQRFWLWRKRKWHYFNGAPVPLKEEWEALLVQLEELNCRLLSLMKAPQEKIDKFKLQAKRGKQRRNRANKPKVKQTSKILAQSGKGANS
jgi:hypothetical protein